MISQNVRCNAMNILLRIMLLAVGKKINWFFHCASPRDCVLLIA